MTTYILGALLFDAALLVYILSLARRIAALERKHRP